MENTAPAPSGILLIDKPQDWTSHDVVAKLRRVLRTKKIGHAGTLDPMATGLLIVLVGKATKLSDQLLNQDKQYQMDISFGQQTDTGDTEGQVVAEDEAARAISAEQVETALSEMIGQHWQQVPSYSAVKIGGKKLYELARQGRAPADRPKREVTISQFELLDFAPSAATGNWPKATCRVHCSKGTYVRVLAEELAEKLGTLAHLTALRRTVSGQFTIEKAHRLSEVVNSSNPSELLIDL